jgi:DNA-binding SARP family transcriptional activator
MSSIERALRKGACWVAAPAGYGKTVALIDYLQKTSAPHIWYRVDEGDQDIASFFHYMMLSLPAAQAARGLPVFGPEYADQPRDFARRFFRSYFGKLRKGTVLVLDDLQNADVPDFRAMLAVLLEELPDTVRCACLSRTLPGRDLASLQLRGRFTIVDQSVLKFSNREARTLVSSRLRRTAASVDLTKARGWAAGLVLLAERASAGDVHGTRTRLSASMSASAAFALLAGQLLDTLGDRERDLLMKLSLLPEITPDAVRALGGDESGHDLLETLHARQFLVTRSDSAHVVFHLHDLLRDYLRQRLTTELDRATFGVVLEQVATTAADLGYTDAAIDLALQAEAWPLAQRLLRQQAELLLAQGRRATLIERCSALPPEHRDAWLCYWLGVATVSDDAKAETWFTQAWSQFLEVNDVRGLSLTAAHAVLSKTDSWRTHEGLATWTTRANALLDRELEGLETAEELLVWAGLLRAVDYAVDYRSDAPVLHRLTAALLERLMHPREGDTATDRFLASESLIEHAGSSGQQELFEKAVDSITDDLRDRRASPWARGLWLVAFGATSARHFPFARRGFPYPSPEEALRAAITIGERESLRGVEFGALYHLQLLMKSRNDFAEFDALVERLAEIADSRYTTQVAVVADCQAAMHTMRRNFAEAHKACDRFMTAIEAANEPPIERWPHFITLFQVLLAERRPADAAAFLEERLPLFDGAVHRRTNACVRIARAFEAKWNHSKDYPDQLSACLHDVRAASWPTILLNTPRLLAELCADALEMDVEPELCRALIRRRGLTPPEVRSPRWPWALKIHVLGELELERDEVPVALGAKAPTRSLDVVRALAIAKGHVCSLDDLYEWLWPDADGDQAKRACEQALHRLRKLLGASDLVIQREGKLRLAEDKVWVDLSFWESRLAQALSAERRGDGLQDLRTAFDAFPAPLLQHERATLWSVPAIQRVERAFVDLTMRLGKGLEQRRDLPGARAVYLRALDLYPESKHLQTLTARLLTQP